MLATVFSRAQLGMRAPPVTIDVHATVGLPCLSVVGLAEGAVRSAVTTAGYEWPPGRVTVNLSPADLPKDGGRFDLPIALAVLAACGHLPLAPLARHEFYGELSLSGELRAVTGMLPAVCQAALDQHPVVLPRGNLNEAQRIESAHLVAAANLSEVVGHLNGTRPLPEVTGTAPAVGGASYPDLADVRGQGEAKHALEIAAAGAHSLLLIGPPGAGKSLLAHRLPGILPPLSTGEALESAMIASASQQGFREANWHARPFRAPHHTSSTAALVGGGSPPAPGEISLAHQGVLFLDELPEFDREALEALREPLETGRIAISRAAWQSEFPARFQLIAAMNPCPCGYAGDGTGRCRCNQISVERYRGRLSGPLLDRLDLHVRVAPVEVRSLFETAQVNDSSAVVRLRVARARERQLTRQGALNSALADHDFERVTPVGGEIRELLQLAAARVKLSARRLKRTLRVARTIADLEGAGEVTVHHVSEALLFRSLDAAGLDTPARPDRYHSPGVRPGLGVH
ncbi:MAG TPA: YifB family Mg chelatase-like AAA ATPase [Steroidobacteraceae bacterium]|jgi:magnesium chelatase family protein|nr:YifB family Mg chelatase-like AAA ATPase [Steroidobacteraceae bacterium]